jgi:hypothetical protein
LRVEDAWEPVVTLDLWERANAVRGTRDADRRYEDRLFAGIARCPGCRLVLQREVNPHGFVSYGCPTGGCKASGSIGAHLLDGHISPLVDERLSRLLLSPRAADDAEVRALIARRDSAAHEFETWRDDVEMRAAIGDRDYREGMLVRARARDDAEAALSEHRTMGGLPDLGTPADVVPTLDMLPWDVRRAVVESLVHSVWVRKSRAIGAAATKRVGERLRVVWSDDRDIPDLPAPHRREALPALEW